MALNLPNFLNAPMVRALNPGIGDLFSGAVGAYQNAQGETQKRQEQALKNALLQQYGAPEKEADIALKQAHADFYRNPMQFMSPEERLIEAAYSEDPETAKALMQKMVQQKTTPKNTLPAQVVSKTINGQIANQQREFLLDQVKPTYIGEGSNKQLFNDVRRYKSSADDNEKKALAYKIATQINAEKTAPELAFLTLTANAVPVTVAAKKDQLDAIRFGWPEAMSWYKRNVPREIQELADHMHMKTVNELTGVRNNAYNQLVPGHDLGIFNGFGQEMIPQGME